MRTVFFKLGSGITILALLAGCTSGQIKARKEQREKSSASAHLYCEFINGEAFPDVDVQLNIEMAKRCDTDKSMTISSYRSPSDAIGMVYCCATREDGVDPTATKLEGKEPKETKKGH